MVTLLRVLFGVLVALTPYVASGQPGVPVPDTLVWDRVALPADPFERRDVNGFVFCGDTLFTTETDLRALRGGGPGYPPNAGVWEEVSRTGGRDVGCAEVNGRSILYVDRFQALFRSLDGGYTVEEVLQSGQFLPELTPGGALVSYFPSPGLGVCRTEDGEAWTCGPYTPGDSGFPQVLASARPGGPIPEDRMLANGQGGPAYSDDDGRTWQPSNLMVSIQTFGDGLCVIDGGPLHGRALASVQNASGQFRIYESVDGATWVDVGPAPDAISPGRAYVYLTAVPGGLVAAWGTESDVWLSGDGGRSWRHVWDSDGPLQSPDRVTDVQAGPDGYLYASVNSQQTQDAEERGGVYRSAEPVFIVADETAPVELSETWLSIRPNPAGDRAEVVLRLSAARQARVVVLDALGREVAVLHDGPLAAGANDFALNAALLAPGVYVVRLVAGATATLTVTR